MDCLKFRAVELHQWRLLCVVDDTCLLTILLYIFLQKTMSSLTIASQIRDFAVNPATQGLIVNDASMTQTLMNFINDKDSDSATILACVEAFHALSKNQDFRSNVASITGLLPKLAELCELDEGEHAAKIASLAKVTLDNASGNTTDKKAPVEKVVLPTVTAVRAGAFGTRGYVHNMLVHVPEMSTDAQRALVETAVINTKGLVSVTIDMQLRNVNIYTSVNPEEFAPKVIAAIAEAGFKASHVQGKDKADAKPAATGKPGYAQKPGACNNKDAVVKYVDKNAKKQKEAPKENGWLGGITSYFW